MKSRWTIHLLLAVVTAVWGAVAWKIFAPADTPAPSARPKTAATAAMSPAADTLRLDYPDPFLKNTARLRPTAQNAVVRPIPATKAAPLPRERVRIVHLGTVAAAGRRLFILTIGDEQFELAQGECAGEFALTHFDADSLYLLKNGIGYGVKLCE